MVLDRPGMWSDSLYLLALSETFLSNLTFLKRKSFSFSLKRDHKAYLTGSLLMFKGQRI